MKTAWPRGRQHPPDLVEQRVGPLAGLEPVRDDQPVDRGRRRAASCVSSTSAQTFGAPAGQGITPCWPGISADRPGARRARNGRSIGAAKPKPTTVMPRVSGQSAAQRLLQRPLRRPAELRAVVEGAQVEHVEMHCAILADRTRVPPSSTRGRPPMPLEIVIVPCLRGQLRLPAARRGRPARSALVDAPEAGPIEAALTARGWGLDLILITHHHDDHIAGVDAAARARSAPRSRARRPTGAGCRRSTSRWRRATGSRSATARREVIDVPGHTVGHIAYHFPEARGALLRRQPDGDGLRAAVRGHARADVGEPQPARGAAGRDAGLFRATNTPRATCASR